MLPLSRLRFRHCGELDSLAREFVQFKVGLAEGLLIRMCLGKSDDQSRLRYSRCRRLDLE